VELVPQGTLAECIRAAGHGLGGVLTPTGIGTTVAEGKRTVEIDGQVYLLELPLRADFALVAARRADYHGNLEYALTARNFNPIMALAAATVIAEPKEIVPVGVIPPDTVVTPYVLVDYFIEMERINGR
jgi:acetate CoA/acetoacetate CoA-transferase alpha subunit